MNKSALLQSILLQENLIAKLEVRIQNTEGHMAFLKWETEVQGIDNEAVILEMDEEIQELKVFQATAKRALSHAKEALADAH